MGELSSLDEYWDVIVIGAGPAGCAAAIRSGNEGMRVLLVDAKAFPRRKACGGCLNQVSVNLLQQIIGANHRLWKSAIPLNMFQLTHRKRQFQFAMPGGVAIDRSAMDQSLVEVAQAAGVVFVSQTTAKLLSLEGASRVVNFERGPNRKKLRAGAVVVACGLGSRATFTPTSVDTDIFKQQPQANSRVGIEAVFEDFPKDFVANTIHMVVAQEGYVGLTQIAGNKLHVAAAVNFDSLQRQGPEQLVQSILRMAGAPELFTHEQATWRGTPPLTATPKRLAAERVFLVGDAAGYVEPFTGEGIRWALETGTAVAPFARRACMAWSGSSVEEWEHWYKQRIGKEQRLCRQITTGLKSDCIRWLCHQVLCLHPRIAAKVISRLNSEGVGAPA